MFRDKFRTQITFLGGLNFTKYFNRAHSLGLHVILRLCPYIDGEQDSGGFPAWLLTLRENPDIKYRTSDPRYISAVQKWIEKLLPMVKPLLYPIMPVIMVEVENEYGSCGMRPRLYYMERDLYKKYLGDHIVYFTVDNSNQEKLQCTIPQVYPTVDFGTSTLDQVKSNFQDQRSVATKGPLVNTEFWTGWFDLWGGRHETRSTESVVNTMTYMYQMNASFNIYIVHTWWNHPNGFGTITTSYDFDVPISEAGVLTPKYFAMRKTIERLTNKPIPYKIPSMGNYWKLFVSNQPVGRGKALRF